MLRRTMIVSIAAGALTAGLTADASAFSGGVAHVVTHPIAMTPGTETVPPENSVARRACTAIAATVSPRPHTRER